MSGITSPHSEEVLNEDYFRVLGEEWNANVIRWQLNWFDPEPGGEPARDTDMATYAAWLDAALARLDRALPWCEKYGLWVVIDLHTAPAESTKGYTNLLYQKKELQDAFVEAWRTIARRYRGRHIVWGYDLANEPFEGEFAKGLDTPQEPMVAAGLLDWHGLASRTARAIREIDPETVIVVQPAHAAGPYGFEHFAPIDVPGIVYSVHFYVPGKFTHQGIGDHAFGVRYPGSIEGKDWNKGALRAALRPVVDFQRRNRARIYVGEFSAIRWAPGESAYRYLRDAIDLFEEAGWDWTYHAFREWDGWSVEHGDDRADTAPSMTQTKREKLLRLWFAKNRTADAPGDRVSPLDRNK